MKHVLSLETFLATLLLRVSTRRRKTKETWQEKHRREWLNHWPYPPPKGWIPPEWRQDLPEIEAAYVFAMKCNEIDLNYRRAERKHMDRNAKACQRAIKYLEACPSAFMAFPLLSPRFKEMLANLETVARYCELHARGKRGRRKDEALHRLIREKHREFQQENPGQKGYWREMGSGIYKGRFLEQMENTLYRLGFPPSSREALGEAIERALTLL